VKKAVGPAGGNRIEERLRSAAAAVGARSTVKGLPVRAVTLGGLLTAVLNGNYDIRASDEALASAGALVRERDAAFDPTLFGNLSYSYTDTHSRGDQVARLRNIRNPPRKEDELDEAAALTDDSPRTLEDGMPCTVVDNGVVYQNPFNDPRCFAPPYFTSEFELASVERRHADQYRGNAGVSWLFPVGLQASLNVGMFYNPRSSFQAPALTSPLSSYDPFGWGDRRYWTSSASLSLVTPLPYTKGFGEDGSTSSFALRLSRSGEAIARLNSQAQRNATLAETLLTYWDLVLSAERLRALAGHRDLLNEQLARARRLADARQNTDYDLHQVEASLAALDRTEEEYWSGYLVTSGRLATLTAGDRGTVLLPGDTEALLAGPVEMTTETAYALTPDQHPDVRALEESLESSRLAVRYRESQALPDVSLSTSFSVGQSDSAFGYKSAGTSLAKLLKPDNSNFYIGVRYVIPLGNNQAEAALSRSRLEETQAYDRVLQGRQKVVNQAESATHDLTSSRAQVGQSQEDVELAALAYEAALTQLEEGRVSQYEVLNKLADLLSARLNRKAAQVAVHKALIRLLYAQGVLEERFAGGRATGARS